MPDTDASAHGQHSLHHGGMMAMTVQFFDITDFHI